MSGDTSDRVVKCDMSRLITLTQFETLILAFYSENFHHYQTGPNALSVA